MMLLIAVVVVVVVSDDRYMVTADGLRVLGVSASDDGDYTCRAEVEADGRYDERRIHVNVHGKFLLIIFVVVVLFFLLFSFLI